MLENNPGMISCEEQWELQLPTGQRCLGGGSESSYRAKESAEKPNFTEALTSCMLSMGWQGTALSILRAKGEKQS